MKYIELSGKNGAGMKAIIDDEDYEELSRDKWRVNSEGYAVRDQPDGSIVSMHQLILGKKSPYVIDHINRNKLDNRRGNLRHVSRSVNRRNSGLCKRNTNGYTGIWRMGDEWAASIAINGKKTYLGKYTTIELAAQAYENARRQFDISVD